MYTPGSRRRRQSAPRGLRQVCPESSTISLSSPRVIVRKYFSVEGMDSISLNPDTAIKTALSLVRAEARVVVARLFVDRAKCCRCTAIEEVEVL